MKIDATSEPLATMGNPRELKSCLKTVVEPEMAGKDVTPVVVTPVIAGL
jgi:hypothetical protein